MFHQKTIVEKTGQKAKQILFLFGFILASFSGYADVFNVNTTADGTSSSGTVNLRGAILAADAAGGTHTINVPAGTYTLTSGQIPFGTKAENITIVGAGSGSTIIIPTAGSRIFLINIGVSPAIMSVNISGIAFKNANVNNDRNGGGAIRCVGPNLTLSLTNCLLDNNKTDPTGTSSTNRCIGGAIRYTGGGTLLADGCTFSNNATGSNASFPGVGGAISFELLTYAIGGVLQYPNTNVTITNTTFSGNTAGTSSSSSALAGALYITVAAMGASGQTCNVNIAENNFINNTASGSLSFGGAISANNGYAVGHNLNINYNRFYGNTAVSGNAIHATDAQGNVAATNNWWGCNGGPSVCSDNTFRTSGTASGTLTNTPYLQLKTTASGNNCTGSGTTITAGFTNNSAGTAIDPANLGAFAGVGVTFTATGGNLSNVQSTLQSNGTATATFSGTTAGTGTVNAVVDAVPSSDATAKASLTVNTTPTVTSPGSTTVCSGNTTTLSATGSGSGTLTYQWYKGATALSNGGSYSGVTTATLTISGATSSVAGTDYYVRVSSSTGCGPTNSSNATVAVNSSPVVNSQPASTTLCSGTTATFSVSASGNGTFSYQWYKGATALSNGATGTGSTIANATTPTLTITNPGSSDASEYSVRITPSTGCTATTSNTATLTVSTLPGFSSQPSSVTSNACTGNPVSFTAAGTGSGTLSYQWYKGATILTNGTTGSGSIISGATTATLTISNPSTSDNATNYNVVVSSSTGCTPATSNNTSLTITPPTTATATSTATESISSTNTLITNTSCNPIVNVAPSGAAPVSGNVTATVTVQGSVQVSSNGSPYTPRYYDITPATNAATATATLTLYYTQAEFTAYNAYPGHGLNLPADATDAQNYKANIRIYIFHGSPNSSGNFPGPTETIDPADANILYNSTYSRWEVTFATTGFSRYYLASAGNTILPLSNIALSGHTNGSTVWLSWKVTGEKDVNRYEVERSTDGSRFATISQVAAGSSYVFADQPTDKVVYYYRIKAVDKDGKTTYSSIIAISLKKDGAVVQVLPNPFKEKLLLNISTTQATTTELRLVDMSGRTLVRKMVTLQTGTNAVTLSDLGGLAKGTYQLQVNSNSLHETIKVMKAE